MTHLMDITAEMLAVGLDMSTSTSLRLAFIDPGAPHFPWTDSLRCCRTKHAVSRYWDRRFPPLSMDRIVVAFHSTRYPDLISWLRRDGVELLPVTSDSLEPFLLEARNYEIPPRYCIAHALANYAAHKTCPHAVLREAWQTLSSVNGCLRNVETTLSRVSLALDMASPTRNPSAVGHDAQSHTSLTTAWQTLTGVKYHLGDVEATIYRLATALKAQADPLACRAHH
jgi:hypothetical protein